MADVNYRLTAKLGTFGLNEPLFRTAKAVTLKPEVDLRPWAGPIKDQGSEGDCTGHAWTATREWINRKYEKGSVVLSAQFVYALSLKKEGTYPQDNGAMPVTGSLVLIESGACPEAEFPTIPGDIHLPTTEQLAKAQRYKTGAYKLIPTIMDVLSCLSDDTPWTVPVGFPVYQSFMTQQVANTGIMPVPKPGELLMGGHEVHIVGYNLAEQWFWVQNSWGDSWGLKGYFKMPFAVAAYSECRMTHIGAPWKPKK